MSTATSTPLGALPVPAEATDGMAPGRARAELQAQLTAQARGGGQGGCHLATLVARLRALSIALARGPHCVHIHVMIHEGHDDDAHADDGRARIARCFMPGFQ